MGLEQIIEGIEKEARTSVSSILTEARQKAQVILTEGREKTAAELAAMDRSLQRELRDVTNVKVSDAERKARQSILSAKEEMIWETLTGIRKAFSERGGVDLRELLSNQVSVAKRSLGNDMEVYAVRGTDAEILRSIGVRVEGILESDDDPPEKVKRYMGKDLIGGFMAFSIDGKKVLDLSFQGMIDRDLEGIRGRISEVLFKE